MTLICVFLKTNEGFPGGSAGKESACNAGDLGLIPGLGRSPGEVKGYPTPVFCPGGFHEHSPWSCKESDMTKRLSLSKTNDVDHLFKCHLYIFFCEVSI